MLNEQQELDSALVTSVVLFVIGPPLSVMSGVCCDMPDLFAPLDLCCLEEQHLHMLLLLLHY